MVGRGLFHRFKYKNIKYKFENLIWCAWFVEVHFLDLKDKLCVRKFDKLGVHGF
jgi:hypothetical protein